MVSSDVSSNGTHKDKHVQHNVTKSWKGKNHAIVTEAFTLSYVGYNMLVVLMQNKIF